MTPKTKINIEKCIQIGLSKNAQLLSTKYESINSKLSWICLKCNKKFEKTLYCMQKSGCQCAVQIERKKLLNTIAASHNGKFLDNTVDILYIKNRHKYKFKCEFGHTWEAQLSSIINGHWCPYCSNRIKKTIEDIQKIAEARGGQCLSTEYIDFQSKLTFKCYVGHIFESTQNKISIGQWCPTCSKSISERIVRAFFEQLFNKEFPPSYPDWLKNSRGNQMELDGYCDDLKIAFEHNGEQHYKKIWESISDSVLEQRKIDDKDKERLCAEHGVKLIVLRQLFEIIKLKDLKETIKQECIKLDIAIPDNFDNIEINLKQAYIGDIPKYMDELIKIASAHEGKILTSEYIGCLCPIECKCKFGHKFISNSSNIKSGYWCPKCGGTGSLKLSGAHEFCNKNNLKFLSDKYINQNAEVEIQCKNNHIFTTTMRLLHRRPYCPQCKIDSGEIRRWTIDDMKNLAKERDGECLSEEYVTNQYKLKWKCNKCNNIWQAVPANILQGRWCPKCANVARRLSLEELQDIAKERDGELLSTNYSHNRDQLQWKCNKCQHIWFAAAAMIKNKKTWCPKCAAQNHPLLGYIKNIREKFVT